MRVTDIFLMDPVSQSIKNIPPLRVCTYDNEFNF